LAGGTIMAKKRLPLVRRGAPQVGGVFFAAHRAAPRLRGGPLRRPGRLAVGPELRVHIPADVDRKINDRGGCGELPLFTVGLSIDVATFVLRFSVVTVPRSLAVRPK